VFIPIFFMPGVIGLLFHEFAVVVGLAILVSAFVSLTLVPMLASRFLTDEAHKKPPGPVVRAFEHGFDWMLRLYTRQLDIALKHRWLTAEHCCRFVATVWLAMVIPKGFFPEEDIGQIQVTTEAAEDTSFPKWCAAGACRRDHPQRPGGGALSSFNGGGGAQNTGRMFITLKPRAERQPMKQVVERLRASCARCPASDCLHAAGAEPATRRRQSKAQYQYILQSVRPTS
jgi:HAE1 family hydrophobic/amphiphilic exporter-1